MGKEKHSKKKLGQEKSPEYNYHGYSDLQPIYDKIIEKLYKIKGIIDEKKERKKN